jgi:hypothetical protein
VIHFGRRIGDSVIMVAKQSKPFNGTPPNNAIATPRFIAAVVVDSFTAP